MSFTLFSLSNALFRMFDPIADQAIHLLDGSTGSLLKRVPSGLRRFKKRLLRGRFVSPWLPLRARTASGGAGLPVLPHRRAAV